MLNKKLKTLVVAIMAAMQCFTILPVQASNSRSFLLLAEAIVDYSGGWFYTLDEMEEFYEAEYYENSRLKDFIRFENGKYINKCNNELTEIREQFVTTTLKLLKQMLDRELTKYLFRLDTFHGHFFVTNQQFQNNYLNLNSNEMMSNFVNDASLYVLFHCAEHLALRNPPQTGTIDKDAQELITKRNIIGRYDAESIEIFTPVKSELVGGGISNTAIIPQGFRGVGSITFKANINGEFSIEHAGQTIRLDLSLCDYYYY